MGSALPMDYPTTPLAEGYDGAAVCLPTRDTGPFGRMANKRLAAGNMFLGTFDIKIAMSDHLHATRFGLPFTSKPDRFTGYYTFEPGPTVQDFYGNPIVPLRLVTRKLITASETELQTNNRSRSAKLRVAELVARPDNNKQ
jgi:hypothetical protein